MILSRSPFTGPSNLPAHPSLSNPLSFINLMLCFRYLSRCYPSLYLWLNARPTLGASVTVVVSAIRARARINNIKANSVILRLLFSFSFHLKRREIKLRCRSNMPQPDSQRIILISNELQNIYLELFQIEFK